MENNKTMKKLLFYIEPHPFRNSFTQMWNQEIKTLIPALIKQIPDDYEIRIFGNEATITTIKHEIGEVSSICLYPSEEESKRIHSYLRQWDECDIERRNDLILGRGELTDFYYSILERIHRDVFEFDYILNWSDNGAVKKYAEDKNLVALFAELGPTRAPFSPTIYFDHEGTNGFASICKARADELVPLQVVSRRIWSAGGKHTAVYDTPLTLIVNESSDEPFFLPRKKYIFVALQLADDLNTVLCSKYKRPLDFLMQIIEDFKNTEYDIVVKGHPGARIRAYNLKAQDEARCIAESYEHVHFLDSSVGAMETISLYLHAEAIISINSSLSFEALLSGKKAFVTGEAIYNISGLMDYKPGNIDLQEKDYQKINNTVSFMMGHYFQPTECVFNTDLVYRLFDFYRDMKDKRILGTREFWEKYAQNFAEGFEMIFPVEFRNGYEKVKMLDMSLVSLIMNPLYNIRHMEELEDETVVYLTDRSGFEYKKNLSVINIFDSCLDKVEDREKTIYVNGWAVERVKKIPPVVVLAFCKGNYVSKHRIVSKRIDVQEIFGLSSSMDFGFKFECPRKGEASEYSFMIVSETGQVQILRKK